MKVILGSKYSVDQRRNGSELARENTNREKLGKRGFHRGKRLGIRQPLVIKLTRV